MSAEMTNKLYKQKKELIEYTEKVVDTITKILSDEIEEPECTLELLAGHGSDLLSRI